MSIKESKNRAIKAATLYIEMRGYSVLEQNWSQGKNKLDIIATKNTGVYFVEVDVHSSLTAKNTYLDQAKLKKIKNASSSWLQENKWSMPYTFASIILDEGLRVLSFNEDLAY